MKHTQIDNGRIAWDVTLTDLEVLGLLMLLTKEESAGGLSEPEKTAKEKLHDANYLLQSLLWADR